MPGTKFQALTATESATVIPLSPNQRKACFVWVAQSVDWLLRMVGGWVIPRSSAGRLVLNPK